MRKKYGFKTFKTKCRGCGKDKIHFKHLAVKTEGGYYSEFICWGCYVKLLADEKLTLSNGKNILVVNQVVELQAKKGR